MAKSRHGEESTWRKVGMAKSRHGEEITINSFKEKLIDRLSSTDIKQVKSDVLPFVRNPNDIKIWSNDYFIQLANMINFS